MNRAVVTFDCAQTLLEVDWRPAVHAVECAESLGLPVDSDTHASHYDRMLRARWHEFRNLNLTRDESLTDAFWEKLTFDWCAECGFPPEAPKALLRLAQERLFGPDSSVFRLYDDVVPCLEDLAGRGVTMAVVSNWDISLHRALRAFGISKYFATVVASMEEGVEKPDVRIFHLALDRLGFRPDQALHVGDSPVDDYQGAKSAGMKGLIIDRSTPESTGIYLHTLGELAPRIFD